MKETWQTIAAYKLVGVRVFLYFFIPFLATFLGQTETWSGETWDSTHWFLKLRIFGMATMAGALALTAFIDQSLAKAKDELQQRRAAGLAPSV